MAVNDSPVLKNVFVVVDDFAWVTRWAKWRLQSAFGSKIRVELANNGVEAVSLFCKIVEKDLHRYVNTIFIDYHMPGLTGADAIKVLRRMEILYDLPPAHVVGCSGDVPSCEREFYDAGVNSVLSKPTDFGEMEQMCLDL